MDFVKDVFKKKNVNPQDGKQELPPSNNDSVKEISDNKPQGKNPDAPRKKTPRKQPNNQQSVISELTTKKWIASFVEDGVLKREEVSFKRHNNKNKSFHGVIVPQGESEGVVTYYLEGKISGDLLTGNYRQQIIDVDVEKKNKSGEKGVIILVKKKHSKNEDGHYFTGFSIFVTPEGEMRPFSYVLFDKENYANLDGTFSFCCNCDKSCCERPNEINMPVLLKSEAEIIRQKKGLRIEEFATEQKGTSGSLYVVNTKNETCNDRETSFCYFYDPLSKKCSIYEIRPVDCRLFPFDVKKEAEEYKVCLYSKQLCPKLPNGMESEIEMLYAIRPLLDILEPVLSDFSNPQFSDKMHSYVDKRFNLKSLKENIAKL